MSLSKRWLFWLAFISFVYMLTILIFILYCGLVGVIEVHKSFCLTVIPLLIYLLFQFVINYTDLTK